MTDVQASYEDVMRGVTLVRVAVDGPGAALDERTAPRLRALLLQAVDQGRLVLVVDLSAIDDIDSSALGVLVGVLKRVRSKDGGVALVVTGGRVDEVLAITGLRQVFPILDTVDTAVEYMAGEHTAHSTEARRLAFAERARNRRESAHPAPVPPSRSHGVLRTPFVPRAPVAFGDHSYEHLSEAITLVTIGTRETDTFAAPWIRALLVDLVHEGRFHLVVDVTAVEIFDSGGQDVFIGGLKRVRAHEGALVLVMTSERTRRQFRLSKLTEIFPIFDTVDRAVEFLGRQLPAAPERTSQNEAVRTTGKGWAHTDTRR